MKANQEKIDQENQLKSWLGKLEKELKKDSLSHCPQYELEPGLSVDTLYSTSHEWFSSPKRSFPGLCHTFWSQDEISKEKVDNLYLQGVGDFIFDGKSSLDEKTKEIFWEKNLIQSGDDSISIRDLYFQGSFSTDELALSCYRFNQVISQKVNEVILEVFLGTEFFANLAKVNALRELTTFIAQKNQWNGKIKILGRVGLRSFTRVEEKNNYLRALIPMASGHIAGVHYMEVLPYNVLTNTTPESEHYARGAKLLLEVESFLNTREDPTFQSAAISTMTKRYVEKSYEKFRVLKDEVSFIQQTSKNYLSFITGELATRKKVIVGVNNYVSLLSEFNDNLKASFQDLYRFSSDIEKLRKRGMTLNQEVTLYIQGDYKKLGARISFVQNIFESIGIKCHELTNKTQVRSALLVHIADDQEALGLDFPCLAKMNFIASKKIKREGLINIYQGFNYLEMASQTISQLEELYGH